MALWINLNLTWSRLEPSNGQYGNGKTPHLLITYLYSLEIWRWARHDKSALDFITQSMLRSKTDIKMQSMVVRKIEANIPGVQTCLGGGLKYERLARRSHSCLVCKIDCPLLFSLKGWQPSCSSFKSGKLNNASQREILCKIWRYPELFLYPILDSADCTWTRWSGWESYHISIVTSSPSP